MPVLFYISTAFLVETDKKRDWVTFFFSPYLYPGHYVPQLAELMIQFNKKEKLFNLKGIAVSIFPEFQSFHLKTPLIYHTEFDFFFFLVT